MAYTKSDLRRLRAARRTVNRRIAQLEKLGLDNIPSITRLKAAFGGAARIPKIQYNLFDEEFDIISNYIYDVFNDTRTTQSGAKVFYEGRRKMIKDLFKGIGVELSEEDVTSVIDYVPYIDFRSFLDEYIYESVVSVANDFIKAGVSYSAIYMERALEGEITGVYAQILVDEGLPNDYVYEGVHKIIDFKYTIADVIREYESGEWEHITI